jgi:hypothetical protein
MLPARGIPLVARGGHVYRCEDCGQRFHVYHGCRNRSCPACHTPQTPRWLVARTLELLPCPYYHVTVTFRYKDRKQGLWRTCTLTGHEFVRRFRIRVKLRSHSAPPPLCPKTKNHYSFRFFGYVPLFSVFP